VSTVEYGQTGKRRVAPTGLPPTARSFLLQIGAGAILVGIAASLAAPRDGRWSTFVVLLFAALAAQAAATHVARKQVFHTGLAFTVAAAVLLEPRQLIAICVVQHLADWARQRYAWYIQFFNIANYLVSALAAWAANHAVLNAASEPSSLFRVAAATAGGAAFVLTNHALLGRMLRLARGYSLRASGLFSLDGLLTDAGLAATGIAVGLTLQHNLPVAVVAAFPLILIHRVLVTRQPVEA
jgi:hypothetical protein